MNTLLLISVLGQWTSIGFFADPPKPKMVHHESVVKTAGNSSVPFEPILPPRPHAPKPEPPPDPAPPVAPSPKIWKAIYRKDSRGFQCQGYTERELDAFIRGRESAFAQQVESQQQTQQTQSFTPILQYQYGMSSCANGSCQSVMMPY